MLDYYLDDHKKLRIVITRWKDQKMRGFRKIKIGGTLLAFFYRVENKDQKDNELRNKDLAILCKVINVGEHMKKK